MLRLGGDPCSEADYGLVPLHLAAQRGQLECCQVLVETGGPAQLAKRSHRQRTPLHSAVLAGQLETVRFLLNAIGDAGAAEGIRRHREDSFVDSADQGEGESVGSALTKESDAGNTKAAEKAAEEQGRKGAMEAFSNTCDDQGLSVLHDAAKRGDLEVARLLLEAGAAPEARSRAVQRTAAEQALEGRHLELVRLISEYAAARGKVDWVEGGLRALYDNKPYQSKTKWHFLS